MTVTVDSIEPSTVFRFGHFELQPAERRLLASGRITAIGPRAFDLLLALVGRAGHLIAKDELLERVWPKLVVEENNLQVHVWALRKILGADAIATVPGKGYRFTLAVRRDGVGAEPPREDVDGQPAYGTRIAYRTRVPDWRRTNLPRQATALVDRATELAELSSLLQHHRLVTLTGSGGVGKTRLALEAASQRISAFADGVWLIELGPLSDPQVIPSTVAATLGIELDDASNTSRALAHRLSRRNALLLLDNCEHVLEAVAVLAEAILAAAPNVSILATSQVLISIAGEQGYRVPSLGLPTEDDVAAGAALSAGAVDLFVQRAKARDFHFRVDGDALRTIARIVRRLDGIPLAIEMAAARVHALGLEELADRLDERFSVLTVGRRTALPRQQTLRATLDWSCSLLSSPERRMLRRLGIFAGGFTVPAACAVAADGAASEREVAIALGRLVSRSLVATESGTEAARHRLLETTRAYAVEMLCDAGELDACEACRARHLYELFGSPALDWMRTPDAQWNATFAPERDNLRAALAWSLAAGNDVALGTSLAGASAPIWIQLSLYPEGKNWLEAAVAKIVATTSKADQAKLWFWLAAYSAWPWAPERALAPAQRAVGLYRELGDALGLGYSLAHLGAWFAFVQRFDEAEQALAEALPLLEPLGVPRALGAWYHWSHSLHSMKLDTAAARRMAERALALYRSAGAERTALDMHAAVVDLAWAAGDLEAAMAGFEEVLEESRKSSFTRSSTIGLWLTNMAGVYTERGDLDEALAAAREGVPLMNRDGIAWYLMDHLALRAALAGALPTAARLLAFADAQYSVRNAVRNPNEVRAHERLERLLRDRIAADELEVLQREGFGLSDDEACDLAIK